MDNQHVERAILACVFHNPDLLIELDIDGRTSLESFSGINRQIVQLLVDLYNRGYTRFDKDLIYSYSYGFDLGNMDMSQIQTYIFALFDSDVSNVNFHKYVEELMENYSRGCVQDVLHRGWQRASDKRDATPAQEILGDIQTELYNLDAGAKRKDDPIDVSIGLEERIISKTRDDANNYGVPTGIPMLDEMMLGFLPGKFYFIASRPGQGKSAFLTQVTAHAALFAAINRTKVLYLDTEIPQDEFEERLVGHIAGVNTLSIRKGDWINHPQAAQNVRQAIRVVEESGGIYHKQIPGYTLGSLINTIRKHVYKEGVGMVVFDYLKTPRGDEGMDRWQKIGNVARALKEYAQILDIPIVTALQQNKKGDQQSRISSDALAESDDPFKEADGVFALNWKTAAEIQKETPQAGTHRFQILKGRYFKADYNGINLRFIDYCLRFVPATIQATQEAEKLDATENIYRKEGDVPILQDAGDLRVLGAPTQQGDYRVS